MYISLYMGNYDDIIFNYIKCSCINYKILNRIGLLSLFHIYILIIRPVMSMISNVFIIFFALYCFDSSDMGNTHYSLGIKMYMP